MGGIKTMYYKLFRKVNGIWDRDTEKEQELTVYETELKTHDISSWQIDDRLQERIKSWGYVVPLHKQHEYLSGTYYLKADCGSFVYGDNGSIAYIKDYTTEEFKALDNSTLKAEYNFVKCEHCGKYVSLAWSCTIKVGRSHYYCSSDCASHHAKRCACCGNWYAKNSSFVQEEIDGYSNGNALSMCNKCLNKLINRGRIARCADCGCLTYEPRRARADGEYRYYCRSCIQEHETPRVIRGYHDQHNEGWEKQYASNELKDKHTFMCGVELECETQVENPNDIAYEIHKIVNANKKLFEFEHDGSLNNGYETISQPCSINWWYENAGLIKQMLEKMQELQCKSHNTSTCGLHVHIGRNFFKDYEYETRFVSIFYRLKEDLIKFSRRNRNNMYYCSFSSSFDKSQVFLCKKRMEGHTTALNLANEHTMEVRIFKGTLDFLSYMSCIELCYNLAYYVREHEDITQEELDRLTFKDIVDCQPTQYLDTYLKERNFFDVKEVV